MDDQATRAALPSGQAARRPAWTQGVSILCVGLGIGWLTGLSVSPVVSGVISTLLGIGAGMVVGRQAVQRNSPETSAAPQKLLDARPAALLVLGIAGAATLGIVARTHQVLEPVPVQGVSRHERVYSGVLFAQHADECAELWTWANSENHRALLAKLKTSTLPGAKDILQRFSDDPETLKAVVKVLCKQYIDRQSHTQQPEEP